MEKASAQQTGYQKLEARPFTLLQREMQKYLSRHFKVTCTSLCFERAPHVCCQLGLVESEVSQP